MTTNKSQAEQLPQDAVMQSVLKASDLRTGNKLLFLGDVVTFKNITEIREDGIFWIKTFEPKIESKNFHFKPIPLTEEWLIKLGFTWSIAHQGFFKKDFYYVIDFYETYPKVEGCIAFLNKNHRNGEKLLSVKYVHELQNLYFALTGSELTVA